MGREIRRVSLGFDWPLDEPWSGFLMPAALDLPECPDCHGDGYSVEARAVAETFYPSQIGGDHARSEILAWHDKLGQAEVDNLVAVGYLQRCVRREPTPDDPRDWEWISVPRIAADVNAAQRGRNFLGELSLDCSARYVAISFRCDRLSIVESCPTCNGKGEIATEAQRAANDAWERTDPPLGDGWQVWETVSEGSPISPVFPTSDTCVEWLISEGYSRDAATAFVAGGWALPMLLADGKIYQDIEACATFAPKKTP